jgi:hypothetical protein
MAFNPDEYLKQKAAAAPKGGFDPDAYLAQNRSLAGATGDNDASQTFKDAMRGVAQGASLGFADELAGGAEALGDTLSGKTDLENFMDAYRKHRDESRDLYKQAQERSPNAFLVGNIAGGVAPALLSGGGTAGAEGLMAALKTGAAAGALTGLGDSQADITKGDVGGALKDAAEGAAGGAVAGGAIHAGIGAAKGIGSGLKSLGDLLADTNLAQDVSKSYKYGKQGVNLVTKEGLEAAEQGARDAAKSVGFGSREALQDAGTNIGKAKAAIKASGKKIDVSDQIDDIKTLIDRLKKSDNPDAIKDVNKLQSYLDNLLLGKEVETPVQYSKFTPGKEIPSSPSARDALELEAAKAKASANALGQNLNTTIVPSEDEQGNKLLTLLKHSDEQVGASERAIPIKDENGMVLGHDLDEGDLANNFKSKASAKTVLDKPAVEGGFTPSERGPVMTETTKYRPGGIDPTNVDFEKAQDIQETLNNLNGVKGGSPKLETNEAINQLKQSAKGIGDQISTSSSDLASANNKYAAAKQTMDILGIDGSDFIKDAATGQQRLTVQGEQKLNNVIKRMARDTDAGENASYKMDEAMRLLAQADPAKAAALKPTIERASEVLNLSQKAQRLGLLNKSTYVGPGAVNAGNIAGLAVNKVATDISKATPQQLQEVAKSVMTQGAKGMRLAAELADVMKKDNVGRNAALFAIQQNPEYREMLNKHLGGAFGDNSK